MTKPRLFVTAMILLSVATSTACTTKSAGLATVTVDLSTRYQMMTGWEATAQAGQRFPVSFSLYRGALFDAAVNDLGINRLRLEIKAGLENRRDWWAELNAGQIDDGGWRCVRYSTVNDNNDPQSINWDGFKFSELDLSGAS
jgi:O-glycosyl hydrolase